MSDPFAELAILATQVADGIDEAFDFAAAHEAANRKEKVDLHGLHSFEVSEEDAVETPLDDAFAKTFLLMNRKGLLKRTTTVAKLMTFKTDLIKMGLLLEGAKDKTHQKEAKQTFKNINGFQQTRDSSKETIGHAQKLGANGVTHGAKLRDEIWLQLMKQTSTCSNQVALVQGWTLIGIISGMFAPSATLKPYVLYHCNADTIRSMAVGAGGIAEEAIVQCCETAAWAKERLHRTVALEHPRHFPVMTLECAASAQKAPTIVRSFLIDGGSLFSPVHSWLTTGQLQHTMGTQLELHRDTAACFGYFAVTYGIDPETGIKTRLEESPIADDHVVLDVLGEWTQNWEANKADHRRNRLVYKVRYYITPDPRDVRAYDLMFLQLVEDVTTGNKVFGICRQLSEEAIIHLAALEMHIRVLREQETLALTSDAGDIDTFMRATLDKSLHRFLPKFAFEQGGPPARAAMIDSVVAEYGALVMDTDVLQAHMEYISYAHEEAPEWYGTASFEVKNYNPTFPETIELCINPRYIFIVDPDHNKVLRQWEYSEIPQATSDDNVVHIHINSGSMQLKVDFHTFNTVTVEPEPEKAKAIARMIKVYKYGEANVQ